MEASAGREHLLRLDPRLGNDQVGNLATLATSVGFFSLFPPLTTAATALGLGASNNTETGSRHATVNHAGPAG